jgi:hypothetical protein
MKQANNNEVDLLLRSLASGRGESSLQNGSAARGGDLALSDHLDADELNSYAEGVAPAAARARYTEHLADCAACRGIVVGLAQSAGGATRYEDSEQKSGLDFWQKLGALFSPPVLRYAVPALVLTAVIGVSLLALRQPQRSEFIPRNQPTDSSSSADRTKQADLPVAPSSYATPPTAPRAVESPIAFDSNEAKRNGQEEKSGVAQPPGTSSGASETAAAVAKDGTKAGEGGALSELRPSYAPEPKAAAPPPAQVMQSETDSLAVAKEQSAKREDQERQRDDASRNQPSDEHGPNRSAAARPAGTLNTRRVEGLTAGRGGPNTEDKKNKASDVETRTVSGKRFTRGGNAWVDTAYESSRATINVARGSEQFRALVADEPGLGAIAQQLNGVVIVVWKNRAYRIQ